MLPFLFVLVCISCEHGGADDVCKTCVPRQVVLTWQQDPTTTMTITWRTDDRQEIHTLRYSHNPDALFSRWQTLKAKTYTFEETTAWLHTVELTGLDPDTDYHVVIDHPTESESFLFSYHPKPGWCS